MSISLPPIRLTGRAKVNPVEKVRTRLVNSYKKGETTMRIIGLTKADKHTETGVPPTKELLEHMGRFIEEVTSAGVLLANNGFQPSSKGARGTLFEL